MSSARTYRVDRTRSRIVVRARSSVHDTHTTWDTIDGTLDVDPNALDSGATGSFQVDMTSYDAGDWLKNRKIRKDFDLKSHPTARFEVTGLREVQRTPDGRFSATAEGILRWRGKEVAVAVTGQGSVDDSRVEATGHFDMDIGELGIQPPRFLMFKVESQVTVEISLLATAL